jgi:hypothetical protein
MDGLSPFMAGDPTLPEHVRPPATNNEEEALIADP